MSAADRREQLLDVLAAAVLDIGPTAVTMERLADLAGVSKALPYNHFESIADALGALYDREAVKLCEFIWQSLEEASAGADLVRVHISAYFEALDRSNDIFGALYAPGSSTAARAAQSTGGPRFTSRVLQRFHGVEDRDLVRAGIVNAAIRGAGAAWRRGDGSRADCEDCAVQVVRNAVGWTSPSAEAGR